MEQVTAALWRKKEARKRKQKNKKERKQKRKGRGKGKRERERENACEDLWRTWLHVGATRKCQTHTLIPLALLAGRSPPCCPALLLGLFCPTSVTLNSSGLRSPAPGTAGQSRALNICPHTVLFMKEPRMQTLTLSLDLILWKVSEVACVYVLD